MKKSTLRLVVLSTCVGAGLMLSGCGGGADDTAGTETAAEEPGSATGDEAAEEAPAAATEDELIAAVEAGGFTAAVTDPSELGDTAGAMGDMKVEPKECEVFMNAALTAAEGAETTLVMGTPSDPAAGTFGGAIGYPSADDATASMETNASSLGACSEITVSMQGMEVSTTTTEIDASIDGADEVFATEVAMELAGTEMTTTSVQAIKGSAIITVTGTSGAGIEGASLDEISTTAADMITALP